MALSVEAVAVAKKYTDNSIKGISGTLAGKNCTIESIVKTDGTSTTTFEWTANDGTVKRSQMQVKDGEDGIGIETINKLASLGLLDTYQILYTDGTTQNYTVTNGKDGENGISVVGVIQLTDNSFAFELSDGSQTDPLTIPNAKITISKESGNILEEKSDGLYVGATGVEISQEEDNAIKTKDDGLYVKDLESQVLANEADITSIDARLTNVETDILDKVDKVDGKSLVLDTDITQITTNKNNIEILNGTGEGSVSKKIADEIGKLTYLEKYIATKTQIDEYIADPTKAKFNVIYLLKVDTATGEDKYKEYQRLGNETSSTFECTGDTSTDLSSKVDKQQGEANKDKVLVVGEDGNLKLDDTTYTKTQDFNTLSNKVNELQLYKFPNTIIYGEPTINNGQISGFTANDYLAFPFLVDFGDRDFAIDMAFTTGSDVTTQQNIIDGKFGLALAIQNSHFVLAISSDGQSWNIGVTEGTYTVLPNTNYYLRLTFNKLQYKLSYSLDKINYTNDITKTSTQKPYPVQIYIGVGDLDTTSPKPFGGIINMNYSYLTVSSSVVWQGMDDVGLATRLAVDLENIDELGVEKIKEIAGENVVTSFNTITSDTKIPSEKLVKDSLDGLDASKINVDNSATDKKTIKASLEEKVDIQQNIADKGKALIVGDDGKLLLGTVATDGLEIVDKTQAEYDALTDEQKNDPTKLYNITDAEVEDLTKYATKEYVNNTVGENIKFIKVDIADIPMSGTSGKYYTTINFTDKVPDGYFPISFFEKGIWDETINFVLNINETTRMFRLDIKSSISAVTLSNASPLNIVCMKMFS